MTKPYENAHNQLVEKYKLSDAEAALLPEHADIVKAWREAGEEVGKKWHLEINNSEASVRAGKINEAEAHHGRVEQIWTDIMVYSKAVINLNKTTIEGKVNPDGEATYVQTMEAIIRSRLGMSRNGALESVLLKLPTKFMEPFVH